MVWHRQRFPPQFDFITLTYYDQIRFRLSRLARFSVVTWRVVLVLLIDRNVSGSVAVAAHVLTSLSRTVAERAGCCGNDPLTHETSSALFVSSVLVVTGQLPAAACRR